MIFDRYAFGIIVLRIGGGRVPAEHGACHHGGFLLPGNFGSIIEDGGSLFRGNTILRVLPCGSVAFLAFGNDDNLPCIPKSELVSSRYEKELIENIAHLKGLKADQKKHDANVKSLKEEVIRCIQGQSAFSQNTLAELIRDAEEKGQTLQIAVSQLEATVEDKAKTLDELSSQFDELLSWADLYNSSSFEAKKMIVNRMIERVDVQKDYKLHISFRFDMNQFYYGA